MLEITKIHKAKIFNNYYTAPVDDNKLRGIFSQYNTLLGHYCTLYVHVVVEKYFKNTFYVEI